MLLGPLAFLKNLLNICAHTLVLEPERGLVQPSQMLILSTAAQCVTRRWTDETKQKTNHHITAHTHHDTYPQMPVFVGKAVPNGLQEVRRIGEEEHIAILL